MSSNTGTIFRCFLNTTTATTAFQINVDTEQTSGRCGVCVENMVLVPEVATSDQQDFWSLRSYVQFSSPSFPPFIDATSDATSDPPQKYDLVFDRVPLIATPNVGNSQLSTRSTYAIDRQYTEDSCSFSQMRNNPNSLGSGSITVRLLDETNTPIPDEFINKLTFTLMIYKPRQQYP
jgi:hypothetical protein